MAEGIEYSLKAWQQDDIVPRNMSSSRTDVFVLKFRVVFVDDLIVIEKRFMVKRERILNEDLLRQHIVGLLSCVRIFVTINSSIVTEIYSTIVDKSNQPANARPKILPIVLEIDLSRDLNRNDNDNDLDLYNDDEDDDDPMVQAVPASEASIRGLEKVELKDIDLVDSQCMICLEELSASGIIRLPCSHLYHFDCIVEWLQKSHLCPLCRFEMPINSEL